MRLLNWQNFNLPFVFNRVQTARQAAPPKVSSMETRKVADALDHPFVRVYSPDDVHFPDHCWATPSAHGLPGNGGYITQGLDMVTYDHQATWDREKAYLADGTTRDFFRRMADDNRIKHI